MDHVRPQETPQSKSSVLWHRDESADKRPNEGSMKSKDEKRPFRRVTSPTRPRAWVSRPRFRGTGFYRPHFFRDDHSFRKHGFGFQKYHHFTRPYFHWRDAQREREKDRQREEREREKEKEKESARERAREREWPWEKERNKQKEDSITSSPQQKNTTSWGPLFSRSVSSREKDRPFTFSQESERYQSRDRDHQGAKSKERVVSRESKLPLTASQIAARSRAIQLKRREIEEVYCQDSDTFAMVVRMLIAKDPSLLTPIQSSLQENLREIGLRCVEAMEKFIEEYDSKELSY